jgi:hypothetical protein
MTTPEPSPTLATKGLPGFPITKGVDGTILDSSMLTVPSNSHSTVSDESMSLRSRPLRRGRLTGSAVDEMSIDTLLENFRSKVVSSELLRS